MAHSIIKQRMTAQIEGSFVVFLIGIRINRPWQLHKWLPVFMAMPRMLKELQSKPELGLLGYHLHVGFPISMVVQYWRSFEQLAAYAGQHNAQHWPAWVAFNRRVGSSGAVGIWHETYCVEAGAYECIYNNMPPYGLAQAGQLVPAVGRKTTAAGRLVRS
ncbi:DUF4188 domain-containing protein [Thermogemmatispora tikiterensis]|uniref:Transcriptional regulator n=1 Tax=Thermogemmatispora tikiterensis TaxID=1825093 RepID=A0A328VJ90_9CHLR|nr:DUF4188 domain-containing protein [Thermogemmatispora tikiterensis]RAQ95164.1 transcriptional regulator [Thermogemmatispora tikiterensis]